MQQDDEGGLVVPIGADGSQFVEEMMRCIMVIQDFKKEWDELPHDVRRAILLEIDGIQEPVSSDGTLSWQGQLPTEEE